MPVPSSLTTPQPLPSSPSSFQLFLIFLSFPDKKEEISVPPAVVMPTPSKRGRKSKQMMGRVAGVGGVLPPGSDALILAHLAAGGQVRAYVIHLYDFCYSIRSLCTCVCVCLFHHNYYAEIVL